jgi:hypothetical protein
MVLKRRVLRRVQDEEAVVTSRSHPPNRPKQWTIGGEFADTLDFDGVPILTLKPGQTRNIENLSKLVASMNAAGVVFKLPKAEKKPNPPKGIAAMPEPTLDELARSCVGKKMMGENAARACALKHRQRAYHCILCHGWHCTHLLPDIEVHR